MNDENGKDFRVKISVRNNNILKRIEKLGYKSVAAFCREFNLCNVEVNAFICFKRTPYFHNKSGPTNRLKDVADKLCLYLNADPEDLWSEDQSHLRFKKCSSEAEFTYTEILSLQNTNNPQLILEKECKINELAVLLERVSPKVKNVLSLRYGLCDGKARTYVDIGNIIVRSVERVRQIEAKGIRQLSYIKSQTKDDT